MFKALATQLSIALFLSHDIGNRDAQEVSELMSTHWRGMISVPVSVRAPWAWWKSGYSKALTAKVRESFCCCFVRIAWKAQSVAVLFVLHGSSI